MKKSIVFTIHPSTETALVIQIEEVFFEESGMKWVAQKRKLLKDILLGLCAEKELVPVKILMGEQSGYLRKVGRRESLDTMDFSSITVDPKRAIPVLKELAATGKLYFNRKELYPNFYGGADLICEFSNDPGTGGATVKGIVKTPSQEFSISRCNLIAKGEPNWFIKDGSLHLFRSDLSWKWIRYLREKEGLALSPEETERLIAELKEEKEMGAPKMHAPQELMPPPSPLPVLELTDQTGAFANLAMEYVKGQRFPIDTPFASWRNREAELLWKKDLLESGFLEKSVGISKFYCPLDRVRETLLFLLELGWEIRDYQGNQVEIQTAVSFSLQWEQNAVFVNGKVKFEKFETGLVDVLTTVKKNTLFTPLCSGHVGLISKGQEGKIFQGLREAQIMTEGVKVNRHDLATIQDLVEMNAENCQGNFLEKIRDKVFGKTTSNKLSPGAEFIGVLREYQKEGVAWLSFLKGCGLHGILADDMGLGKTVQVLAFLSTIQISKPVLIVAPTSLLFNWKLEFEKFLPSLSVCIHHGTARSDQPQNLELYDVILTSYSILRSDQDLLQKISFLSVVLDEAQVIKNANTQAAKAACRLQAELRLSLTGTPIENHPGELLSQFKFLIPDLFDNLHEDDNPAKIERNDPLFLQRIKKKIKPFILRRRKADVDEQLPEKIEQTVWLEMGLEERKLYNDFLSGVKQGIMKKVNAEGLGKHRMEIFEAILRLRQICCHPHLVSNILEMEPMVRSRKCDTLFEDVATLLEEGQKVLLYSQFTSMLQILKQRCLQEGWKYLYLDGATKDREEVVRQFQQEGDQKLFLISLKAGGVGLNLTAADYVILYEPWWNEAVENQAIDRAHRIGRHHPVIAKRYIFKDTIEERIMVLKEKKRGLAEDLFSKNQSIDKEDLDFLFE